MDNVLVLNADFRYHAIVSWRSAVILLLEGKAQALENYDTEIHSVHITMKIPAVLRLLRYVKRPPRIKLTRANLLARDGHKCQYCLKKLRIQDTTFDHIVPRSRGGARSWTNLVSVCKNCNAKKADSTPEEAGMQLAAVPYRPKDSEIVNLILQGQSIHDLWKSYLYWHTDLETTDG